MSITGNSPVSSVSGASKLKAPEEAPGFTPKRHRVGSPEITQVAMGALSPSSAFSSPEDPSVARPSLDVRSAAAPISPIHLSPSFQSSSESWLLDIDFSTLPTQAPTSSARSWTPTLLSPLPSPLSTPTPSSFSDSMDVTPPEDVSPVMVDTMKSIDALAGAISASQAVEYYVDYAKIQFKHYEKSHSPLLGADIYNCLQKALEYARKTNISMLITEVLEFQDKVSKDQPPKRKAVDDAVSADQYRAKRSRQEDPLDGLLSGLADDSSLPLSSSIDDEVQSSTALDLAMASLKTFKVTDLFVMNDEIQTVVKTLSPRDKAKLYFSYAEVLFKSFKSEGGEKLIKKEMLACLKEAYKFAKETQDQNLKVSIHCLRRQFHEYRNKKNDLTNAMESSSLDPTMRDGLEKTIQSATIRLPSKGKATRKSPAPHLPIHPPSQYEIRGNILLKRYRLSPNPSISDGIFKWHEEALHYAQQTKDMLLMVKVNTLLGNFLEIRNAPEDLVSAHSIYKSTLDISAGLKDHRALTMELRVLIADVAERIKT